MELDRTGLLIIFMSLIFLTNCTVASPFSLESSGFSAGTVIPLKYTCEGDNVSPPVSWSAPPKNTKSFVLICDDPDAPAGTWVHWVIFNIPGEIRDLPENIHSDSIEWIQGKNDFGKTGYGGPCPPEGTSHRYFFRLYALDTLIKLKSRATREQVDQAMEGHILSKSNLMGRFKR